MIYSILYLSVFLSDSVYISNITGLTQLLNLGILIVYVLAGVHVLLILEVNG